ncbi:DHHW family protein [Clostridium tagluense]|uniref:Membrane protein n=1 Tax=Clostridium tagluense TaxID=360422 RepID=A0A401UH67_9CLOT|nr:DHHW family protein [Clostridium tagluense]GCD08900.1 membrane protein [Clostridium tagluense]
MEFNSNRKKYNRIYIKSLTLIFLSFIFSVMILNIIVPSKDFSEEENRKLKNKPKFTINNLLHNRFTSKYEKYISDQFILRNFWINVKSKAEILTGKKENNDVYLGDDSYLIDKFNKPSEEDFAEKLKAINTFSHDNKELSKYIMLVPNKVEVLKDKLPAFAPVENQLQYINKFYSGLDKDIKSINVFDTLNKNKDKYIYYKTDHHWTTYGAYYAYLEFCKSSGITPKDISDYDITEVNNKFYGTLYSRAGVKNVDSDIITVYLPKTHEDILVNYIDEKKKSASLFNSSSLNTKDKYSVFLGGNHPIIKTSTMNLNNKHLLVIKDSYANCFIPFLTSHFGEIIVVDLRYYSDDVSALIKDYNITDVLMLYNTNTFFEDQSILNISNYE